MEVPFVVDHQAEPGTCAGYSGWSDILTVKVPAFVVDHQAEPGNKAGYSGWSDRLTVEVRAL